MARSKKGKSGNDETSGTFDADSTGTGTIERPEWVDGAPVTSDGQFVREGSPRPTPQMQMGEQPDYSAEESGQTPAEGKNWGDPYKAVFSCREMGFELGEDRRFKQRVFKFSLKPAGEILDELKENGFIYRPAEKAWTVTASPQSRKLTDDLARKWAGPNYIRSLER